MKTCVQCGGKRVGTLIAPYWNKPKHRCADCGHETEVKEIIKPNSWVPPTNKNEISITLQEVAKLAEKAKQDALVDTEEVVAT